MAASDKHIGKARCPLCGSDKATVGLSAKGWPYLIAPCCKAQVFARGHESDAIIRALLIESKPAAPASTPAPKPAAVEARPVEATAPPPAPPKRPAGFGLFGF
jgi:hypothetical protein